jgi:hypothetical protein
MIVTIRILRHHRYGLGNCNDENMQSVDGLIKFHVIKLIALRVIVGYALTDTYTRIAA